ncbi:(2Fe-2S)-binding protein [Clostridium polyendosporum]|uniref:(2Fe-2S)-binding protein n=1 Tax=Clostridium polyendosporum TaxID=69208 RepID=A0A919VFC3_9CLOT|nr:FAD-dependent oxidoreductase [Clostridium polyendosporum]GIM27361.1 (2Fe-2S)-binding protein [Clostridium polyendosporum]
MENNFQLGKINNVPYWISSTPKTNFPPLKEDIAIDYAIIGGGISGLTTAYFLAKEGLNVAVFEADRICEGTTGRTTGKITSQHNLLYYKLIEKHGYEIAKSYADANDTAIDLVESIINTNNIDCDFQRLPAFVFTQEDNYIADIQREVKAAQDIGLKANYHSTISLPLDIKAAISFDNQAQFHPRKYLLSLSSLITKFKGLIFENTPIISVEAGKPCILTTKKGNKIKASNLIICSHFPCYDGFGLYFTKLNPKRTYILAIKAKEPFPKGMFINAEKPNRSLRYHPCEDGELILVVGDSHKTAHGESEDTHYQNLFNFSNELFTVEDVRYRWSAQDYTTPDDLPYVGRLTGTTENIYVATGFKKWGLSNSTAGAMIIKNLIIDGKSPWFDAFNPSRGSSFTSKSFFLQNFDVGKELIKGKINIGSTDINLEKGEAKIVQIDRGKYGAYRDMDGKIHIVDTTCTHMGCEVKWNKAEKSWDCPCHGSRFSYTGDNLEGPAAYPLNYYGEDINRIHPNIL